MTLVVELAEWSGRRSVKPYTRVRFPYSTPSRSVNPLGGKAGIMAHVALSINGQEVFGYNTDDYSQAVNVLQGFMVAQTQQMKAEVDSLRSDIMALTQAEQQRFDEVSAMINEVGTEVGTFVGLLNTTIADLQAQVAALEAAAEAAAEADLLEDAAYQEAAAALQASIDALQAAAAEHEGSVVAAFDSIGVQVTTLDESVGGDAPVEPDTTTTEPPFETVPVTEDPEPIEGVVDDSGAIN